MTCSKLILSHARSLASFERETIRCVNFSLQLVIYHGTTPEYPTHRTVLGLGLGLRLGFGLEIRDRIGIRDLVKVRVVHRV